MVAARLRVSVLVLRNVERGITTMNPPINGIEERLDVVISLLRDIKIQNQCLHDDLVIEDREVELREPVRLPKVSKK
jgi:hypothetical protein